MDIIEEFFFEKIEGFLEKLVPILERRINTYSEPQVMGEKN